jgi:hypothetical protein
VFPTDIIATTLAQQEYQQMHAGAWIVIAHEVQHGLNTAGYHIVSSAELEVARWNADKRHRCPRCHAVAVDLEQPRWWRVYTCCCCGSRFTRWPSLAWLLPDAGIRCAEHAAELVEDEVARIRERAREDRAARWSAVLARLGWRRGG